MNQSNTACQLAVAAAVTQAVSLYLYQSGENISPLKRKVANDKINKIKNRKRFPTVGIKFDNNSARKYFAIIHAVQ